MRQIQQNSKTACPHTHTHTHARTHSSTHARTHTHIHTHTHTHIHTHTRTHPHAHMNTRTHTHTKTQSNAGAAIQLNTHDCMDQPSFKTPSPLHQLKHVLRTDQLTSKQNTSSKWGQMVFFRTEVRLTSLCLSLPHDKVTMA